MKLHYSSSKRGIKDPHISFRNRLIFLSLCLLGWSCLIVFKLVKLQLVDSGGIRETETRRMMKKREISALRGEIRDRNGKPLAISSYKSRLILDPAEIKKPAVTAEVLAGHLGEGDSWIKQMTQTIQEKKEAQKRYYQVRSHLPYEKGRAIYDQVKGRDRDYRLAGVHVDFFPERHYPKRWLGSHVIGFVNKYESAYNEGLERRYDKYLSGVAGEREVLSDAMQNDLALGGRILKQPSPGAHLELTIDENIQFLVENELQYGMTRFKPDGITCIVMEPETGDILSMANVPDFNPEHYGSVSKNRKLSRRNKAVEHRYDPASAFKIVTIASALELGTINLNQKVYCEDGRIKIHGRTIRDHKKFGTLTYREVLWYSSNVGAIKAALTMSKEQFREAIVRFGFGKKTGIDLPAETEGKLWPLSEWHKTSPAFIAIGHEIGVTPLQMLVAANTVANGGFLVQPRVGKKLIFENGREQILGTDRKRKQILSSSTVNLMKDALIGVVEQGTAKKAALSGVKVFGKTGTAQRITRTGYSDKDYNASFVGFFPAEKPRYGIIVVVYNPHQGGVHGGDVAAPIFSRIGERLLWYESSRRQNEKSERLNVASSTLETASAKDPTQLNISSVNHIVKGNMPDLKGLGLKTALKRCASAGIYPEVKGSGWVVDQFPKPNQKSNPSKKCWILMSEG